MLRESERKLRQLDKRYKRLTDQITTYLETQASAVAQAASNLCDFFVLVAKMVETHRKAQKGVDNQSADEVWDLKEDFRFELEDREVLYERACQKIRECTKDEELQMHFQEVLSVLDGIAQSYRDFHSNACFANDKYPLMLMHDFRGYLDSVCQTFFLVPDVEHGVVVQYEQTFDETIRLNRKYFEANGLAAAGFERIPLPVSPPFPIRTLTLCLHQHRVRMFPIQATHRKTRCMESVSGSSLPIASPRSSGTSRRHSLVWSRRKLYQKLWCLLPR